MRLSRSEWLAVSGAALVLASVTLPAAWAVRSARRLAVARAQVRAIYTAALRYHNEYGTWPSGRICAYGDCRFGWNDLPNREVMNALRAASGPGNEKHALNVNRVAFLEAPPAWKGAGGITADGDYLDPWARPYQVVLDSDLDGLCDVAHSIYGSGIGGGVLVWSYGPDRTSDTADDLISWKR